MSFFFQKFKKALKKFLTDFSRNKSKDTSNYSITKSSMILKFLPEISSGILIEILWVSSRNSLTNPSGTHSKVFLQIFLYVFLIKSSVDCFVNSSKNLFSCFFKNFCKIFFRNSSRNFSRNSRLLCENLPKVSLRNHCTILSSASLGIPF